MKKLLLLFGLLTALNVAGFVFRDRVQYVKESTYRELYGPCGEDCLAKWDDFKEAYNEADWQAARRLLAGLRLDTGTTLSKAHRIGNHLFKRFNAQMGNPKDTIHRAGPLQAYAILSADTAQDLICGTYGLMYNFFCWSAGIACRNVEIYRPGDHHVMNEVYLPEQRQWAMVDLTTGMLGALKGGRLQNVRDLTSALDKGQPFEVIRAGRSDTVSVDSFSGKGTLLHYYQPRFPHYYYHAVQADRVYSGSEKLRRYFLPESWYEVYSDHPGSNPLFFLRLFLTAAWLILAGTILFKFLRK